MKFLTITNGNQVKLSQKFEIEAVALNSLGWEIRFRDLECEFQIIEGEELVDILNSRNNKFEILAKEVGFIKILANSKYSLNPSLLSISIIE